MDAARLSQSFRLIRKIPFVGAGLRWAVRQYREGSVVGVRAGAAKGIRWKRFHRYDPSVWLGTYEPELQQFLQSALSPGEVFYDVGANAGFFTVLAARLVGEHGRVVAFEPQPDNIESLNAQIEANGFRNVAVIPKAVSARSGPVKFSAGSKLSQGHIGEAAAGESESEALAVSLDEVLAEHRPPDLIKVDIEGGGIYLAQGAQVMAEAHKPVWILEVHNGDEEAAFKNLLLPFGYHFRSLDGRVVSPDEPLPTHVIAACDCRHGN